MMKKNCELCNVLITHANWARDLKSETHLKDDPDQTIKPRRRVNDVTTKMRKCELCGVDITYKNWARHLKSQAHLKNDPDQTVKPKNRTIVRKKERKLSNPDYLLWKLRVREISSM